MEKHKQSYQEVSKVMEEDLQRLKEFGVKALDDLDIQDYFFKRKQIEPDKYKRLEFSSNHQKPYSQEVSDIISDFLASGILYTKYYLIK